MWDIFECQIKSEAVDIKDQNLQKKSYKPNIKFVFIALKAIDSLRILVLKYASTNWFSVYI